MSKKTDKIIALNQKQMLIKRINLWMGRELGDSDSKFSTQKSVALREIIDNSIDAIRKGNIKKGLIKVTFFENGSIECYDNGPGIPTEITKTSDGKSASSLLIAMGILNSSSNYENMSDSLGTNGVGGSCTTLLSEYAKIEVYRNKNVYKLDFENGEPGFFDKDNKFSKVKKMTDLIITKDKRPNEEKKKFPTGTKINIKLNDSLFKSKYPVNIDDLIERLKGVAFLVPNLAIEITNHLRKLEDGSSQYELFNFTNGMEQLLDLNVTDKLIPIQSISNTGIFTESTIDVSDGKAVTASVKKDIKVDLTFTYSNNYDYFIDSYVNTIKTRLHGFHVQAFEKALVTAFNKKFRSMRSGLSAKDDDPIFQDYSEGLAAVVSVNIPEPEFTNQIKEELGGKKAFKEFTRLYTEALDKWVNTGKNQDQVKIIADKVIAASKNRIHVKEQQELKREKKKLERTSSMPTKLVDCEITHDKNSELFILEGDSALGGLKSARDSSFQALIPIRGKIINVMKSPMKTVLANKEVQDIIKCLDAGIGKDFKMENSRYGRVIIAADADPDGGSIANLLLVLCWKLFPELVTNGNLYKACTPLFIVTVGKKKHYCFDKKEYNDLMKKIEKSKGNKKIDIVRAKGLGETGADTLFETGMSPETRTIERITVKDIKNAEKWLEISMGTDVAPRREWIEDNPMDLEEIED